MPLVKSSVHCRRRGATPPHPAQPGAAASTPRDVLITGGTLWSERSLCLTLPPDAPGPRHPSPPCFLSGFGQFILLCPIIPPFHKRSGVRTPRAAALGERTCPPLPPCLARPEGHTATSKKCPSLPFPLGEPTQPTAFILMSNKNLQGKVKNYRAMLAVHDFTPELSNYSEFRPTPISPSLRGPG